jgi:NTP pyrophosphatase (non-canonical NTP hydrolase)
VPTLWRTNKSEKESDKNKDLGEELAGVVFVVLCLANQTKLICRRSIAIKIRTEINRDKTVIRIMTN